MDIRIIRTSCHDGYMNMALDESILVNGIPALRFYTWERPCVSLGYFQKSAEINSAYLEAHSIELVRRLTGGKAVYHWQELTYSIVLPETYFTGGIHHSYRVISTALLTGLKKLGLDVYCNEAPDRVTAKPNCFSASGWFEICIHGRKLVGNAQVRKKGWILQQGSVLIDRDDEALKHCFISPALPVDVEKPEAETAGAGMTAINHELEKKIDHITVAGCLEQGFRETMDAVWECRELTANERALALQLAQDKYRTTAWNYRR